MFRRLVLSTSVLVLAITASMSAATVEYQFIDLGAGVNPRAINRNGDIAVVKVVAQGPPPITAPFVLRAGVLIDLRNPDWTGGLSQAINASGTVAGRAVVSGGPSQQPFVWSGTVSQVINIGMPAQFNAVNDYALMGGGCFGPGGQRPFLYDGGVLIALPAPGALASGSTVNGLNNTGVAVGVVSGQAGAARWSADHQLDTLPPLGGTLATAFAVNDAGVVVGRSSTATAGETRPVAWVAGETRDLGSLGGTFGQAVSVNAADQIVGASNTSSSVSSSSAFLFENGVLKQLDTLIDPAPGWTLTAANAINDGGVIVGTALPSGGTSTADLHGFMLVPFAASMLEGLQETTAAVPADAALKVSLGAKLAVVGSSLTREDRRAAHNQLGAFVNQVDAQKDKKIDVQAATELITRATALQKRLE